MGLGWFIFRKCNGLGLRKLSLEHVTEMRQVLRTMRPSRPMRQIPPEETVDGSRFR